MCGPVHVEARECVRLLEAASIPTWVLGFDNLALMLEQRVFITSHTPRSNNLLYFVKFSIKKRELVVRCIYQIFYHIFIGV